MRASTLKRFIRHPRFDEHLSLHRLDCLSSHRSLDAYDFVRRTLEKTPAAEIRPERYLTGNDLQALGFQPGPSFSQILHALEDAQLEGLIKSKEGVDSLRRAAFRNQNRSNREEFIHLKLKNRCYPIEHYGFTPSFPSPASDCRI